MHFNHYPAGTVISLWHQYRARLACTSMQSWLDYTVAQDRNKVYILISPKLIMGISKKGSRTSSFKYLRSILCWKYGQVIIECRTKSPRTKFPNSVLPKWTKSGNFPTRTKSPQWISQLGQNPHSEFSNKEKNPYRKFSS